MKNLKIGISYGYLGNYSQKGTAMRNYYLQGINYRRVYGIFNKGWDDDIQKIKDALVMMMQPVNGIPTCHLLICLNGLPHSWLPSDLTPFNLTAKQIKVSAYYNGLYINQTGVTISEYIFLLKILRDSLKDYWPYISWELAGEPDNERNHWGTFEEFKSFIQIRYAVFVETKCNIYIAGFTSSLMRYPAYKNKQKWMDWINSSSFYGMNGIGLSSSFYLHDSGGTFNFKKNSYPNGITESTDIPAIVSEYNSWASITTGKASETDFLTNWGRDFIRFLQWVYFENVDIVYLHPACDDNKIGKIGLYKKVNKSFSPKQPAFQFSEIYQVIKDGYEPTLDGIRGKTKEIWLIEGGKGYEII